MSISLYLFKLDIATMLHNSAKDNVKSNYTRRVGLTGITVKGLLRCVCGVFIMR